jgi:hypothetical protein
MCECGEGVVMEYFKKWLTKGYLKEKFVQSVSLLERESLCSVSRREIFTEC